jgi:hypothetical protein
LVLDLRAVGQFRGQTGLFAPIPVEVAFVLHRDP